MAFSLSLKSYYGTSAIMYLGERYEQGFTQIKDIASRCDIPQAYLEQIFNRLGKQNIVTSMRGNKGGYRLAIDPAKLTVLEVILALDGEISCARDQGPQAFRELLGKVEEETKRVLGSSISDLVSRQQSLEKRVFYSI